MAKTSRTSTQSRKHQQKRLVRKHPIPQLSKNIEKAFGADKYRNPCVIKHCPAKQGYGVFARRDLRKGEVVAYYVIKLFKHETDTPSPTKAMYTTVAPSSPLRPDLDSRTYFGDIGQHAGDVFGRYVFRGKPVLGHVINEPGQEEIENVDMPNTVWDASLLQEGDGKTRTVFKEGDVVFHDVKTLRAVKKGDELLVMYASNYERNYKRGKKFTKK